MRRRTGGHNQIARPVPEHLIGDARITAMGVMDRWRGRLFNWTVTGSRLRFTNMCSIESTSDLITTGVSFRPMATTSNTTSGQTTAPTRGQKAAATRKRNATRKSATATKSNARRTAASTRTTARRATSATTAESRVRATQAQQIAERVVLVPVGASLMARDNVVSTVKGFATKYRTRAGVERELRRYERRGVTARNRFERQVRRTRTRFERQLRQRRNSVERSVRQNRRRFEREVRSVRKDLEKQSGQLTSRFEKLVSDASDRIAVS